jgi:vacuolar-type H+-ATPase subunit H
VSSDNSAHRRDIEDSTAARLAEIVAAAEKAAKSVIDEAEAEARARLSDAHEEADRIVAERLAELAALTAEIDAQAEALKRGSEALQAALARARSEFGGAESLGGSAMMRRPEVGPLTDGSSATTRHEAGPAGDDRPAPPSLTVVGAPGRLPLGDAPAATGSAATEAEAATAPEGEPEPTGSPAGARLLATQMAVSGSSREEIDARLRSGFEIADTTAILDAILGPER